ncbi:uncharacterized protein [Nicotiana tomentosiformis]|uniref:uncharacterized protein n=1 Tax=Nicotiana tomentosiformis TaxID=4098 RepID=UPI00388CAFCD
MGLKIKEEVTKQIKAKVLKVVEYPTWLDNIVPVPKKDGKVRVCVDYRDLNRESPKDDFPLPNLHILIDNYALATLSSMIKHPEKNFIDPISIGIHKQPAYYAHIEEESNGNPLFHDIKEYLAKGEYPEHSTYTQKCMLRRLANHFFQSGGILHRRTPDLRLLQCVDAKQASRLLEEIHVGICGPHMNGFVLAKKILRAGYFWITMETDCIKHVQKCNQCQIHAYMIRVPPNELNPTSAP